MNWHRLRDWLEPHDTPDGWKSSGAEPDLDELATRVARWCSLVLRFGAMISKYCALAAGSVQTPGRHHLALMLYGSSLAEYNSARASLRASVASYARALDALRVTPEQATRMTLEIVHRPSLAAIRPQPASDAFMRALGADITTWCRDAYTSSTRSGGERTTPLRTLPPRLAGGVHQRLSVRQRYQALVHRNSL